MRHKVKYGQHFVVPMIPYITKVLVSLGEDNETIVKLLCGYKCPKHLSQPIIDNLVETSTGYYVDFDNGFILLAMPKYPISIKDFSTLVHEVTHVAQATLAYAGIKVSVETTEVLAYATGYLYHEIMKKI